MTVHDTLLGASRRGLWGSRWAAIGAAVAVLLGVVVVMSPSVTVTADVGGAVPGSPRGAAAVVATGFYHSCALLDDSTVKCWGENFFGQLGLGDKDSRGDNTGEMGDNLLAVDLGSGRTAVAVTAGGRHSCALLDDGTVKCWGDNGFGQLGLGDTDNRGDNTGEMGDNLGAVDLGSGRTATTITAGFYHSCALLDDSTVKCWGYNVNGQLGQGDTDNRGDQTGEMGDNLLAVDLGSGRTATAITAGNSNSCALLDDSTVKCWGNNFSGQLGQGDTASRGDSIGEMGDNLGAVDLGSGRTATAITAGGGLSCALLDDSTVKCWGNNFAGQLGQGDTNNRGDSTGEMGDNLGAVDLGSGRTATAITAGSGHSCALLDDNAVKCWGYNIRGQLGQGDTDNRGDNTGEMGDNLVAVDLGSGRTATAITAGAEHSCALLDDSTVKCWGANFDGQLGQGDTDNRGDNTGEMGDNLVAVALGAGRSVVPVVAAPAAPTSPVATAGSLQVLLRWTAPVDDGGSPITGWRIQQSTNSGVNWIDASFGSADPAGTTITNLTNGTTYVFRVRAVNNAGAGVASATSAPVTPAATVPGAPGKPLGVGGDGQVTVSWTAPASDGGSAITGYTVTAAPGGAMCSTTGALSCTVNGLTNGTAYTFTATAANAVGTGPVSPASSPVTPVDPTPPPVDPTPTFVSLTPARVLNTRGGAKVGNAAGTGAPRVLKVTGAGGVPASGVGAVALNVTVTQSENPTIGDGFVTVYPCDKPRPDASNLNFVTGQTVPNSVIAPVSANGEVCFYVYGTAHLLADVSGYFPTGAGFNALTPSRIMNTRGGAKVGNAAGTGAPRVLKVTGAGGVPASGVAAVVLNVTVTQSENPTIGGGFVTVYPCDKPRPDASNLNFVTGQTVPNSVIAPVSANGEVCFYVYGTAHLLADVSGYIASGAGFESLTPARIMNTRTGAKVGNAAGTGAPFVLKVAGAGGVPATGARAVVLNVTVTQSENPTIGDGFVTVYPCDKPRPDASNLNFVTGQTVPNSVIAPVSANGEVCFYVYGTTHLLADVSGVFL